MKSITQMHQEIKNYYTTQDVLNMYNIEPNKSKKIEFMRAERTPSVHVYDDHLCDFGDGDKIYSLVDIVMYYDNANYVTAVKYLHAKIGNTVNNNNIKKEIKNKLNKSSSLTHLEKVQQSFVCWNTLQTTERYYQYEAYLSYRGLPNAARFLKRFGYQLGEVTISNHKNLAIKFSDDHFIYFGGIFGKGKFKGSAGPSNIALFDNSEKCTTKKIIVTEAWADTLAYYEALTMLIQTNQATKDIVSSAICLNSVSNADKAIQYLLKNQSKYKIVELWLDNDDAGNRASAEIKKALEDKFFIKDLSGYNGYKDAAELWQKDFIAFRDYYHKYNYYYKN